MHTSDSPGAARAQKAPMLAAPATFLPLAAAQALDLCRPIPTSAAHQEKPSLTSVWPSIVLRGAQLIFAALIVAALASTVSFARSPAPQVPTFSAEGQPISPSERPPLDRFAVIAQRNVFRSEGPRIALSGAALPNTALDLELVGTLVAGEGRKWFSVALIRDARDQVASVREGEKFVGGQVRLVSIEPRRIVIENGGKLEVLALGPERDEQKPKPQRAVQPGLAARAIDAENPYDTRTLESLRSNARIPTRPGTR